MFQILRSKHNTFLLCFEATTQTDESYILRDHQVNQWHNKRVASMTFFDWCLIVHEEKRTSQVKQSYTPCLLLEYVSHKQCVCVEHFCTFHPELCSFDRKQRFDQIAKTNKENIRRILSSEDQQFNSDSVDDAHLIEEILNKTKSSFNTGKERDRELHILLKAIDNVETVFTVRGTCC